jgi:hypothetical protein
VILNVKELVSESYLRTALRISYNKDLNDCIMHFLTSSPDGFREYSHKLFSILEQTYGKNECYHHLVKLYETFLAKERIFLNYNIYLERDSNVKTLLIPVLKQL